MQDFKIDLIMMFYNNLSQLFSKRRKKLSQVSPIHNFLGFVMGRTKSNPKLSPHKMGRGQHLEEHKRV